MDLIKPREVGEKAYKIWLEQDRKAAIDYIDKNCKREWKKLAWRHCQTFHSMGVFNANQK